MAIKGLTNQKPQFPQIGQLRKGIWDDEKNMARDLDYFRFTSDIPEVVEAFHDIYGDEPRLVNVFLPHQTTDENWEAWCEEYVAGGLIHRCDGEFVTRYRDRQSGKYIDPEPGSVRCPYGSGEKERTQKEGCHPTGRLQVVVRELKRFAYVMVITTSYNDIKNLDAQLRALEGIYGDLRGIPMQLRRRPDKISTPQMVKRGKEYVPTGQRARRESWLLSIEAAPDWADLQLEAQRIQALPDVPKQIEAPKEEWEIVEGEPVEEKKEPEPPPAEEPPPEEEPVEEKPAMTLGEALGTPLHTDAPKLELEKGDYLLLAVRKDAKDLFEYLTKSSSYKEPTFENTLVREAAKVILADWDKARRAAMSEEEKEVIEAEVVEVDEGGNPPLF
jgi:hypothetical protein